MAVLVSHLTYHEMVSSHTRLRRPIICCEHTHIVLMLGSSYSEAPTRKLQAIPKLVSLMTVSEGDEHVTDF